MDIRINPVGFSVNPVLEEFINKKFSKLEKYHDGIMSIDVTTVSYTHLTLPTIPDV